MESGVSCVHPAGFGISLTDETVEVSSLRHRLLKLATWKAKFEGELLEEATVKVLSAYLSKFNRIITNCFKVKITKR